MNKISALLLLTIPLTLLSGCVVAPSQPRSRVDVGGSFVNGDLNSFYFSLGEYYRVPERDVIFIRERRIPDHEIPVVLFISQRARVTPSAIINLRLSGSSWMDISLRFGLGPDVYYVPVQSVYGSPYGHAYGHYQNRNRNEWQKIRLADDDVVNLVNLRFISERYGYPAEEVMRMRSSGKNFMNIHDEARRSRPEYRQQERRDSREPVMQQERQEKETRQQERRDGREPVMQREREARQPERRDTREPVMQQERQEKETRQQERRDGREPVMQQERETRQPERRDTREPVMRQERQEKETRQQDHRVVREPVKQQSVPDKASRQQERKETRESAIQQDQQQKASGKKGRSDDEDSTEPQDKKGKGTRRGMDEGQAR